jgi:transposase
VSATAAPTGLADPVFGLIEAHRTARAAYDVARAEQDRRDRINAKLNRIVRQRFAHDKSAVHAAITQPWSNGQVEAQITKLKLVKRQMYGRAKLDLLQARAVRTNTVAQSARCWINPACAA